jgi:hypothetical protein
VRDEIEAVDDVAELLGGYRGRRSLLIPIWRDIRRVRLQEDYDGKWVIVLLTFPVDYLTPSLLWLSGKGLGGSSRGVSRALRLTR